MTRVLDRAEFMEVLHHLRGHSGPCELQDCPTCGLQLRRVKASHAALRARIEALEAEREGALEEVRAYIRLTETCGKGAPPMAMEALNALARRLRDRDEGPLSCRICGRPGQSATICEYCDRMMEAAEPDCEKCLDRGEWVGPESRIEPCPDCST